LLLACWKTDGVRGKKLEMEQFFSELGVDICLLEETDFETGQALRFAVDVCHGTRPPDFGRRHNSPCLQGHKSLPCSRLGSASPGGYCYTITDGDQTSEAHVSLLHTKTTLDRFGTDLVSARRIPVSIAGDLKAKQLKWNSGPITKKKGSLLRDCPTETLPLPIGRILKPQFPTNITPP
jgi:hypothetical protein